MSQAILNIHHWVSLPTEIRHKLRMQFRIPCSSSSIVSDGVLETDGTTVEDFRSLTIEKMQEYTGETTEDFHKLFDLSVEKASGKIINANVEKNVKSTKKSAKK
jgi:hypothetical protein